jgi:hypothetical protein
MEKGLLGLGSRMSFASLIVDTVTCRLSALTVIGTYGRFSASLVMLNFEKKTGLKKKLCSKQIL